MGWGRQSLSKRGGINPNADERAFKAALENIDRGKLTKMSQLSGFSGDGDEVKRNAGLLLALLAPAGVYAKRPSQFNKDAYNAALDNLTVERIQDVQPFFDDRAEATYVLFRAASRFINDEGAFDKAAFNKALDRMTKNEVQTQRAKLGLPSDASAADSLPFKAVKAKRLKNAAGLPPEYRNRIIPVAKFSKCMRR